MRATIVSLLVLGCTAVAHATDRPISGAKLVLTRSPSGVEKLTFLSKDPGFLFPAIGGASDPSVAGASVRVVSPFDAATLTLPPGAGNPGWRVKDATLDAYTYTNGAAPGGASSVRSAKLRQRRGIKIVGRATGLALATSQGSVGIRVVTGSLRSCALFDAATVVVDQPGRFIARGAITTSLVDCSDASLGSSNPQTTCGDGFVEGGEACDGGGCGSSQHGCFPPGDANGCNCCSTEIDLCYAGGEFGPPVPCCPGLQCRPGLGFPYIGSCTSAPCGSQGNTCGGSFGCCDGLVCTLPAPGYPTGVCEGTTTSTSTTLPPSCGNGIVEAGESCDGNACDDGFGSGGCFPPGDANACRCCSSFVCWPPNLKCCPGYNCAAGGMVPPNGNPAIGFCTTSTCTDKGRPCLDLPSYLACCDGLTCSAPPGQAYPYPSFCLVAPGGPCAVDTDCAGASAHCIDGTCAAS